MSRFMNDEQRAEEDLKRMLPETEEPVTTEPEGDDKQAPPDKSAEPEDKPEEEAAAPVTPEETPGQDEPNSDTYKQRWKSLQGVYRSEKARWEEREQDLLRQIDELKTRQPVPQEENFEDIGDDYVSPLVTDEMRSRTTYKKMKAQYGQKHAELHFESKAEDEQAAKPTTEETTAQAERTKFLLNLDRLAPRWRELNNDPDFNQWLNAEVPYSGGKTRLDLVKKADAANDAVRAAEFFNDYEDEKRQTTPQPKPDVTQEDLVEPARRGSTTTTTVENHQGQVYTEAQWNEGWKKVESLSTSNPKEAKRLEDELTLAHMQGRVVG